MSTARTDSGLVRDVLAGVGVAAVSFSLVHGARVMWNSYKERRNTALEEKCRAAEALVHAMENRARAAEAKLATVTSGRDPEPSPRRKLRVYIDGCFDMMHFGHSNALRQARAAGDELIVGLINDEEIVRNKGSPPVMPEGERLIAVKACKFVDEVITNAPYDLTKEWVDYLVSEHKIDYIVHGDDPCITADGKDAYAYAKSIGRFKLIKRTEGVSTTDIVGRMLLMSKEHHVRGPAGSFDSATDAAASPTAASTFLATSRRLTQFSSGKAPGKGDRVVYIAGSWDLFNVGHILALEKAREFGDFLLVGIHDDDTVNRLQGGGFPILNLNERTLSVLSCRYVDEVIIGAPLDITEDMIKTMNISVVVQGTVNNEDESAVVAGNSVASRLGILRQFPSPSDITVATIIKRILDQRDVFSARYKSKAAKEADYVANKKEFVEES
jgi:ethanolamine-phosphate cytidylyltransferase